MAASGVSVVNTASWDMRKNETKEWSRLPVSVSSLRTTASPLPRLNGQQRGSRDFTDIELANLLDLPVQDRLQALPQDTKPTLVSSEDFGTDGKGRPVKVKLLMCPKEGERKSRVLNLYNDRPWQPFASDVSVARAHEEHRADYYRGRGSTATDGVSNDEYDWKSSQMARRTKNTTPGWREKMRQQPEFKRRKAQITAASAIYRDRTKANVDKLLAVAKKNGSAVGDVLAAPPAFASDLDLTRSYTPKEKADIRQRLRREAEVDAWDKGIDFVDHDGDHWDEMGPFIAAPLKPIGVFNQDEVTFHNDNANVQANVNLQRDYKLFPDQRATKSSPRSRIAAGPSLTALESPPHVLPLPPKGPETSSKGRIIRRKQLDE